MSQLIIILAATKEIEFNKKFKTQIRINNLLIVSNFVIWLTAIFLLGSCGSQAYPKRHSSLDKGEYTSMQCLKNSKGKSAFAKRPVTSEQRMASLRAHTKRHE